jgi:hypothetical protein
VAIGLNAEVRDVPKVKEAEPVKVAVNATAEADVAAEVVVVADEVAAVGAEVAARVAADTAHGGHPTQAQHHSKI